METEVRDLFQYRNLKVYQNARSYVKLINSLLEKFPEEDMLANQLRRSSYSVPSKIAEGSGRVSHKQKQKFIESAYGCLMESLCQLEIVQDFGYIEESDMAEVEQIASEIAKMLSGWIKKLTQTDQYYNPYSMNDIKN